MKKKFISRKKTLAPPVKINPLSKSFPIVAIGASAGGLEAVTDLLKNLSPDTGMAYVYIQHLDPSHESMLSTILSKSTRMKVLEAKNKTKIEANHLYIIPPNKDMIVVDGTLKLNPRPAKPAAHMPINYFFTSLAEKRKEGAIGIVLSGNASDGSLGLKAIKIAGGLTFAQDDTAKFQSMPKSAIAEGAVDLILSPREIAKELERLGTQTSVLQKAMSDHDEVLEESEDELLNIFSLLKRTTGVDFTHYKRNTIKRRIVRRMLLYKLSTLRDYTQYLKQHTAEVNVLYQDLLINVTSFFRDAAAMEFLKKQVFPRILKTKASNDPIRIWVPACSTGEEAYSIAMVLMEVLGDKIANTAVQLFATDLSEAAITKARLGVYSKTDLLDISARRQQRFFTKVDINYRIIKSIRDLCVFAPHNIFKDPPFSRIDLISCCNLLIYLDTVLQKKVISTFHYSLNSNGYLVLGKSETIGTSGLFTSLDKKLKVYARKKESNAKTLLDMTYRMSPEEKKYEPIPASRESPKNDNVADLERTVDSLLLNRYVPGCVVVNQDLEILQFRGSTSLYLEPAPGRASLNLLKMARVGLGFELRNLIHKASKSGEAIRKSSIEIRHKNNSYNVGVEVVPLKTDTEDKHFLVLFNEIPAPVIPPDAVGVPHDRKIKQIEQELMSAREDMRSMIEEQEAVNEELQSANEEIVSSNEELQSINEELETSKEEVESTNEELMTINQEMQVRNEQLAESYEYAESMLATIREAIIILDADLRVKNANRAFYKMFHETEQSVEGNWIYEIGNGQWNIPRLRELLEDIIPSNNQFQGFELKHTFPEIGEKVLLLNARKLIQKTHRQELILVALEDITEHVNAQTILRESEERVRNVLEGLPQMAIVTSPDGTRQFFNKAWYDYTGQTIGESMDKGAGGVIHPDELKQAEKTWEKIRQTGEQFKGEFRYRSREGNYRWHFVHSIPVKDASHKITAWVTTATDIDEQRALNELLRESSERLRGVLEGLPQMAWMTNATGDLIFVNKGYTDYTGQTLEEAKENGSQVMHPDDYKNSTSIWQKNLKAGIPIEVNVRYKRKSDGDFRWHLVRALPIKDSTGQITSWVGTNTDVHDQKMFSEELERRVIKRTGDLREANLQLERSNNDLSQFAYAASHDLQEPLRKIQTFSDLLQKQKLAAETKQYAEKIAFESERMSRLINDVLNFSRATVADDKLETVDLNEVVAEVMKDFEVLLSQNNAEIKIEKLPAIKAIRVQMSQLFHNLLSNSFKFRNDGKLRVNIGSRKLTASEIKEFPKLDKRNGYFEIAVSDNGIGFDQKYAQQIFSLFHRLNSGNKYSGSGIGLALCQKIVHQHGGEIFADSKKGEGATFYVILPGN